MKIRYAQHAIPWVRNVRRLILLLCVLWTPASEGLAASRELRLFIWSEYIDPAVVAEFERQHGCRVIMDFYEDTESMLARMLGGGDALYDVVVPSDNIVPVMIRRKLLAPLNAASLTNRIHLEARFRRPDYDPEERYTVPYLWGTMGLLVRPSPGQTPPDTWGLLFDPKLQIGPFVLIDSARDLFAAALRYLGCSLNSTNPADLRRARDLLLQTKKRAVGFEGSVGGMNKVLGRSVRAAIVYSGEAARAIHTDTNLVYLLPREGSVLWVDNLAIPARAPHRDLAEAFINWLLEPRNAARIANFTRFASPHQGARPYLNPSDLQNPAIYPPEEAFARLDYLRDLGPALRLYDEAWTQLKAR